MQQLSHGHTHIIQVQLCGTQSSGLLIATERLAFHDCSPALGPWWARVSGEAKEKSRSSCLCGSSFNRMEIDVTHRQRRADIVMNSVCFKLRSAQAPYNTHAYSRARTRLNVAAVRCVLWMLVMHVASENFRPASQTVDWQSKHTRAFAVRRPPQTTRNCVGVGRNSCSQDSAIILFPYGQRPEVSTGERDWNRRETRWFMESSRKIRARLTSGAVFAVESPKLMHNSCLLPKILRH